MTRAEARTRWYHNAKANLPCVFCGDSPPGPRAVMPASRVRGEQGILCCACLLMLAEYLKTRSWQDQIVLFERAAHKIRPTPRRRVKAIIGELRRTNPEII